MLRSQTQREPEIHAFGMTRPCKALVKEHQRAPLHIHGSRRCVPFVLLSTNRESRYEAQCLKLVYLSTVGQHIKPDTDGHAHQKPVDVSVTYFNFAIDTLPVDMGTLLELNPTTMTGLENVQALILMCPPPVDGCSVGREAPLYLHQLVQSLLPFRALRKLRISEATTTKKPTDTGFEIVSRREAMEEWFSYCNRRTAETHLIQLWADLHLYSRTREQISFMRQRLRQGEQEVDFVQIYREGPQQKRIKWG